MISYIVSCELSEFPAWGSAATFLEELTEHPQAYEYLEEWINFFKEDEMDASYLNDLLKYEVKEILDIAGFYDCNNDTWTDEENE